MALFFLSLRSIDVADSVLGRAPAISDVAALALQGRHTR